MKQNMAMAERAYAAPHEEANQQETNQREANQREVNQFKIVGRDAARRRSPEDTVILTRLDKLQVIALSLVQEIKSLSIVGSKVDVTKGVDFYDEVRRFEVDLIRQALVLTDGHQIRAARLLGLGMTTLNSMIKRYGISPHDPTREPHDATDE